MNRKHSFAVRCLALVLALVMILSNANLGLTMHAQAAEETSTLFELIAASEEVGTKELNAILAYADALPELDDETVKYETAPEAADATLRQDTLAVNAINGWVPYTYTVGGETKEFGASTTVALPAETYEASVVYKLDLNKDEKVKATLEYVAWLADEAGQQAAALDKVSGGNAMMGLMMLDYDFTWLLIDAINSLTLKEVGIDVDALAAEKVDEILDELLAGKLTGNAEIDEQIEKKAREEALKVAKEKATEEAEKELAAVKAEYVNTIEALQNRMVVDGYYYEILNSRGKREYADMLTIYAMLKEYKKDNGGLPHFYAHSADIINEMAVLGETLYDILGEEDEVTGEYANTDIINALFVKMDAGDVDAGMMAEMAKRMTEGAVTLAKYTSYTEIDGTSPLLGELCKALAKCGTVEEYSTDLCLYSQSFKVLDDSWKYVNITVEGIEMPFSFKYETDAVLTEADVAAILEQMSKTNARHFDVETDAIAALVGTVMTETVELSVAAKVKVYEQEIVDAEGNVFATVKVVGNKGVITLPVSDGHITTYKINNTLYVASYKDVEPKTVEVSVNDVADGVLVVEMVEDVDQYKDDLIGLVTTLNDNLGREAVTLTANEAGEYVAMTADISMNELVTFAQTFIEKKMAPVALSNSLFIYEEAEICFLNIQALIDAMMNDETFSSEKLIAMGQGTENNLLTTTMQVPGYDMEFKLNLTTVPEQMATVSKGLNAVKDFMWFNSNNGVLDIQIDLPEKVYEAYVAAAVASGYMTNDNVALSNEVTMRFVDDYINYIMDMNIDANTFNNTLKAMHIDKDVSEYYEYYAMVKALFEAEGFNYTISEQAVDFVLTGDKEDIMKLMDVLGLGGGMLDMGMKLVSDAPITGTSCFNLVKEAPQYEALVVEPGKALADGYANKLNVIDMTDDLVAKAPTIGSVSSVMLLDDVDGNLTFNGNVILDLNGKTINGSVLVNGIALVIDSNLATYEGGTVTGSFSAKGGMIIGGTFGNDISAFLRDGYIQDKGAVRNAMYYIEGNGRNYTYVLNADFYQLYDGYLPSVEALAIDIATDIAMNAYPTVGMAYDGKMMYGLNLDELLNSYLMNGLGGAFDAMMTDITTYMNVEGINALANDLIDDLCNIQAMADALNNDKVIGRQYKFSSYPATVKFMHNEESNTLDIGFVANTAHPHNFSIGLKIEGENRYYEYAKNLLTEMSKVFFIDAEVHLQQPTWYADSNKLTVGGGAYVDFVLDLSTNSDSTQAIAIILAYGNPDRAEEILAAKGCVMELNKVIGDMTVEEVVTALKAMNRNTSIAEMADAVGYKYSVNEVARLEAAYHTLLCGLGKVLEVLDVTGCDTKLSFLADAKADVTIEAYNKVVDASVMGFTGVAELEFARFSFTLKMAPKCTGKIGDVNRDGNVDARDAAWILTYDAENCTESELHMCVADVNADGYVDSRDAAWILTYDAENCAYEDFPAVPK